MRFLNDLVKNKKRLCIAAGITAVILITAAVIFVWRGSGKDDLAIQAEPNPADTITAMHENSAANAEIPGPAQPYVEDSAEDYAYEINGNEVTITGYKGDGEMAFIPSEINGMKVTAIGNGAFSYCVSLTSVIIPNGVTSIGHYAFANCTGLTSITIPDSVTSIGEGAFYDCVSLISVTIPNSVISIGSSAFHGCTGLTNVTIPNSVTSIGGWAFADCTGLTSITIPDSVTSIGSYTFSYCESLTSVIIPDSVIHIGEGAFSGCVSLISVTIPNSVISIGSDAFYGCTGLTNVTIPNSVTSIGDYAFAGCTELTDVTIPDSVIHIDRRAFRDTAWYRGFQGDFVIVNGILIGYKGAGGMVIVPNGVTSISGWLVFYDHKTLITDVTIPDSVIHIDRRAFRDTAWYRGFQGDFVIVNDILIGYKGGESSIVIPAGTAVIADYAFEQNINLTTVTMPDSVTHIGDSAFLWCNSLENVIMPDNVTVGEAAFFGTPWSRTEDYFNKVGNIGEDRDVERVGTEINYQDYAPFSQPNKVVKADFTPTFFINANYPRLDGATAFYPIYSAVAETVYRNLNEHTVRNYVECTTTIQAYNRLINGEADIIFCLEPSQAQLSLAEERGVNLVFTPISREAFVFFVNADNPVDNLTTEQIRDIYSRRITNWREVGGEDRSIMPFQRAEGSGSQTIMQSFMQGRQLAKPLTEEFYAGMGDILSGVAEYRNYGNSIGYSFRFYATVMNPNAQIKMLSVNGVLPTAENISNGTYPLVYNIYAVTTEETAQKENVKLLIDWILSAEGQRLIELSGYSRVRP